MAVRFRNLAAKEWFSLFAPFLLSFVLGILLRLRYRTTWPLYDLVYTLADALVVAGIIGSLLELFSAKLLIQKVADDLAGKLVGRGLPPELQSHIQEITKTALVSLSVQSGWRLHLCQSRYEWTAALLAKQCDGKPHPPRSNSGGNQQTHWLAFVPAHVWHLGEQRRS